MALSVTLKASGAVVVNGLTGWSSASFTPANNSLLVVMLSVTSGQNADVATPMTITDSLGTPLTYTKRVTNGRTGDYKAQSVVWTAPVTTGAAMTVTFDCGSYAIYSAGWFVYEITGHDTTTPTGGTAKYADDTTDGAVSITLDAAPASGDYTLASLWVDSYDADASRVTPGTGFTETGEVGGTDAIGYGQAQYRTSSTSTGVGWDDIRAQSATTYSSAGQAIVIKAAAGGTTLTVADASHSHTAEAPALTQHNILVAADAAHAHAAEAPALTQHNILVAADTAHAHTSEAPTLTAYGPTVSLTVADAGHAHAADNIALTQHHILSVDDAGHAQTADAADLTQHHLLAVADSAHAHSADAPDLTQHNTLEVQDAWHNHTADGPVFGEIARQRKASSPFFFWR